MTGRVDSLTADQLASMVKMARKKKTPKEIADALGLSNNLVRVRLCRMRKGGILEVPYSPKNFPVTDDDVREFFKLHKKKSVAQIKRDTGHASDYITRLLERWIRLA